MNVPSINVSSVVYAHTLDAFVTQDLREVDVKRKSGLHHTIGVDLLLSSTSVLMTEWSSLCRVENRRKLTMIHWS